MQAFFHSAQDQHIPKTYFTRGQMRQPQEVPDRTGHMLEGLRELGVKISEPVDRGAGPISRVHDLSYLRFLQSAHRHWMEIPEDWGDEVMSNIFVREPNALRGICSLPLTALVGSDYSSKKLLTSSLVLGGKATRLPLTAMPSVIWILKPSPLACGNTLPTRV
ncbi:hypothetical protein Q6D67_16225 [Haliea sp. E1-2-M8]|uniref:hypothetical protein n=1 Tax=Haliea sp. E1-2-M8 TaxID=3064706 RepID=UPI00271C2900|nr:hypothetical protein [Haliea sp. E1-2-M8]MDO8863253.1 hypothetical protein [Haliea sp. E1-2-M8]